MAENKNLKNVILWLISQEIVESQEKLAEELGYNSSSLSQIVSGIKPLSEKFIKKLIAFCDKINPDYFYGKGEMLKTSGNISQHIKDIKNNHGYIGHTSISGDHNSHIGNINGSVVSGANIHNENRQPETDISEIMAIQRNYQELLKESQSQVSRLIAIIEKNNDK